MPHTAPLTAQSIKEFGDAFFSQQQMNRLQDPGAALVIVQGDQILYSQGYGFANVENHTPVSASQTLFRAGSVSKLFTATALMQLSERGQLDLNADINTYLTRFQVTSPDGKPVNAAHLLTHTSGLEENYLGMHVHTPQELAPLGDFLARHLPPITSPPGTIISYNDHGYTLAGYLVEEIAGQPFEQYIAQNILEPLGMASSTFDQPPAPALLERMAVGYHYRNGSYRPYPFDYVNVAPAASLVGPAEDMAHFIIAMLNEGVYQGQSILSPETLAEMQTRQVSHHPLLRGRAYGFSEWLENGQRALFHDGGNPGFMSRLFLLPDSALGFYLVINADQWTQAARLSRLFTTQFLDTFFPDSSPQAVSPQPPADFSVRASHHTGYYRDQAGYSSRTLTKLASLMEQLPVRAGPDNTLLIGSNPAVEVQPLIFRWQNTDAYAIFRERKNGLIDYLFFGTGAYKKLPFYETQPFQLSLVIIFLLAFLGMILVAIFAHGLESPARWLLGGTGLLNLGFLMGMALAINQIDRWEFLFGIPPLVKGLLVIPFITIVMTLIILVLTGLAWSGNSWTPALRGLVTCLAIAAVAFVPFLSYWNLLGFRQ
jgi:CubicO group peptidase (beta-lactamase class C family)